MKASRVEQATFTKDSLKKQFRWSEFLAEKIISSVAFLSIAIIFLIFVFVFKESLPLFSSSRDRAQTETSQQSADPSQTEAMVKPVLIPDTYGDPIEDLAPAADEAEILQPDTYGEPIEDLIESAPISEKSAQPNQEGADKTWSTFASSEWGPVSHNPRFGLLSLLVGTLKVTLIAMLIAGPLAILAAVYTSCFASKRHKEIIKPVIEMLAAFPSVVIGFFAMMVLASFFQDIFGYDSRLNAFIGGVAMALAALPIVYTISEDALSSVPKTFTEASLALGASKAQTAFLVVLPAATPGIFAALLLGIGRVFGETMIALMATGNAALFSANPFESVRTFAATIGSEMAETVFGETHYSVLFFIGALLFVFSFVLNAIAEFYVKGKLIKKFQGK
jgi:phosphate transport system permease protein